MTHAIPTAAGPSSTAGVAPQTRAIDSRESAPDFQRLLESLERLARPEVANEPVEDTDSLKRALADAESGFQQVMDLRRHLEDAFQKRIV